MSLLTITGTDIFLTAFFPFLLGLFVLIDILHHEFPENQ